jgi:hypothetical protein
MKTLYESLLDDFDAIANAQDSQYKTLRDCMNGCVTNGLSFRLGPTHFIVSDYAKLLKKKYKVKPISDRNGKKLNPQVTGDIIAIIADQVEIDWSLDSEARLQKALDDFVAKAQEMRMPEIEKYREVGSDDPFETARAHARFETQTDSYEINYVLGGPRKNIKAAISLSYGMGQPLAKKGKKWVPKGKPQDEWGTYTINILDTCPLCV